MTVTIATDMSSANYCVATTIEDSNGYISSVGSLAVGSFEARVRDDLGALKDPGEWHAVAFGDQ